ncbi:MAG: hypothetical protein J6Y62_03930 [Clostridia bacterium]|nr:hypothetical protein [Clostridia bacterium]
MKLSMCKTRRQAEEMLKGPVWDSQAREVHAVGIRIQKKGGVFVAVVAGECAELYSSKEEALLDRLEAMAEYQRNRNEEARKKLTEGMKRLRGLESSIAGLRGEIKKKRLAEDMKGPWVDVKVEVPA